MLLSNKTIALIGLSFVQRFVLVFSSPSTTTVTSMINAQGEPTQLTGGPCVDKDDNTVQCREWAWFGECERNKEYMHDHCRKSCGLCIESSSSSTAIQLGSGTDKCYDAFHTCDEWRDNGKCHGLWTSQKGSYEINNAFLIEFCPVACDVCDIYLDDRDMTLGLGLPQEAPGMYQDKHLYNHLRAKVSEVRQYILTLSDNEPLQAACKMSHPNCARMALATDCDEYKDHDLIKYGCAAACGTCENLLEEENGIAKAEAFWKNALQDYENTKNMKMSSKTA